MSDTDVPRASPSFAGVASTQHSLAGTTWTAVSADFPSGGAGAGNRDDFDGFGNAASFNNPTGVAMDAAGAITIIVRMRQ